MNRDRNSARLAIFATVFALVVTGCQQGGSGAAFNAPSTVAAQQAGSAPNTNAKITSSCPKLIGMGGGEKQTCTFAEAGYSGKFHITEQPKYDYTFTVSPTVGNTKTKFVVQAMYSGGGHFSASDTKGNRIILQVRVSG